MGRRGRGEESRPGSIARTRSGPPTPGPLLIVEDDACLREILGHILEQEGHRVVTAANGEEALQHVPREPPRLVITDLVMPVLDGHALLERLGVAAPHVPVIVLTDVDRPRLRSRLNVARVLRKPVPFDGLLQAVEGLLGPGPPPCDTPRSMGGGP